MSKKTTIHEIRNEDQEIKNESLNENEHVEDTEEAVEKPYTFRKLSSKDMFLMFTIISKIGINEFMGCLKSDTFKNIVNSIKSKNESDEGSEDDLYMMGAVAGVLEISNVIFKNIHKCENEIYQLLSNTSNLSIEEITSEGNAVMFVEMVIDFLKKEEFPDFIKVVSKLFK